MSAIGGVNKENITFQPLQYKTSSNVAAAGIKAVNKAVNKVTEFLYDDNKDVTMDFSIFGVEDDSTLELTDEMVKNGIDKDDYKKVVRQKQNENKELQDKIKNVTKKYSDEKSMLDEIERDVKDSTYETDLYMEQYDNGAIACIQALHNGLEDKEVLEKYGLTINDKDKNQDELLKIAHNTKEYKDLMSERGKEVEEAFQRHEFTKDYKARDYNKFNNIRVENEYNLELLKANEKNAKNDYKLLEYSCITLLKDYKNQENDLSKFIDNPKGDERYVNELGGEYLKIYNYLKENDKGKVDNYLDAIKDQINQQKGKDNAEARINELEKNNNGDISNDLMNYLNVSGKGFGDGVYDFGEGFYKIFTDGEMTAQDYEAMIYMAYLTEHGKNHDKVYTTMQGVGNMTPTVATSVLVSAFAPEVAPYVTSSMLGLSSFGTTKNQMLYEGYDKNKAMLYSALSASSDAILEVALGGIENVGVNAAISSAEKKSARAALGSYLLSMGQEGAEEVIQNTFQAGILDTMVLGKEVSYDELSEENLKTFFQSAAVTGILNAGTSSFNLALENGEKYVINNEQLQNVINDVKNGKSYKDSFEERIGLMRNKKQKESINDDYVNFVNYDVQQKVDRYNQLMVMIKSKGYQRYYKDLVYGKSMSNTVTGVNRQGYNPEFFQGLDQEFVNLQAELKDIKGMRKLVNLDFDFNYYVASEILHNVYTKTQELNFINKTLDRVQNKKTTELDAMTIGQIDIRARELGELSKESAKDYLNDNQINYYKEQTKRQIYDLMRNLKEEDKSFVLENSETVAGLYIPPRNITEQYMRGEGSESSRERYRKYWEYALKGVRPEQITDIDDILSCRLDLGEENNKKVYMKYVTNLDQMVLNVSFFDKLFDYGKAKGYDRLPFSVNGNVQNVYRGYKYAKRMEHDLDRFIGNREVGHSTLDAVHAVNIGFDDYLTAKPYVDGYNNGKYSVIKPTVFNIEDCILHESIHHVSAYDGRRGFKSAYDNKYVGINEATTEYFAKVIRGREYVDYACGYNEIVNELQKLVDNNVLDLEDLKDAYFANDLNHLSKCLGLSKSDANKLYEGFDMMIFNDDKIPKRSEAIRNKGQKTVSKIINFLILNNQ